MVPVGTRMWLLPWSSAGGGVTAQLCPSGLCKDTLSLPAASLGCAISWDPQGMSSHELSSLLLAPVSGRMKLPFSLSISATGSHHSHLLLHSPSVYLSKAAISQFVGAITCLRRLLICPGKWSWSAQGSIEHGVCNAKIVVMPMGERAGSLHHLLRRLLLGMLK